jgi:hypothetical protein
MAKFTYLTGEEFEEDFSLAPRDGTKVMVLRKSRSPLMTRYVVKAKWTGRCWVNLDVAGTYMQDDGLLGWRNI